ncbi:MAG: LamG-like jellyroll fold domain-containing protein, partial [Cyclobacteriaceae bacterium]
MRLTLIIICILISASSRGQLLNIDFDRPTSGTLQDQSQYAHPVNHFGELQYVADRFGNACRAAEFTGSQFLEIPTEQAFDIDQEFTAMVWLKLPENQKLQWITLICKGLHSQESSKSPAFRVQMTSRTVSVNTSSTKEIDEITQAFPEGRWFHFATTFDNGLITLYVDGTEYRSFDTHTYLKTNDHSVTIGYDIPGDEEYFKGVMDDLYFFDSALKTNDILKFAKDKSGKNLGGICPVDPPATPDPKVIASTDPWDIVTIDDFDPVETPDQPQSTNPATDQPAQPFGWDDIPIDEVFSDPPQQTQPDPGKPSTDPWADIDIDHISGNDPDLPQANTPIAVKNEPDEPLTSTSKFPIHYLLPKQLTEPFALSGVFPSKVEFTEVDVPETTFFYNPDPEPTDEFTGNDDETDPVAGNDPGPVLPESPVLSEPILVSDIDSLTVGRKMILDKIEFARHKHHLNDRSKHVLKKLVKLLKKNPDYNILLEGHTEIDGNREANMALSQRRADACRDYLIKRWRIKPRRIETKYYGPDRPITRKKEILWKNRRVEVT